MTTRHRNHKIFLNGEIIEIEINKTPIGDYIVTASIFNTLPIGVCRSADLEHAKKESVNRLLKFKKITNND